MRLYGDAATVATVEMVVAVVTVVVYVEVVVMAKETSICNGVMVPWCGVGRNGLRCARKITRTRGH